MISIIDRDSIDVALTDCDRKRSKTDTAATPIRVRQRRGRSSVCCTQLAIHSKQKLTINHTQQNIHLKLKSTLALSYLTHTHRHRNTHTQTQRHRQRHTHKLTHRDLKRKLHQ